MDQIDYLKANFTSKEWNRMVKKISYASNGCWIWTGSLDFQKYGMAHFRGRTERVHRLFYSFFRKPIPRGVKNRRYSQIDHICNNPSCCNPEHLRLVTQRINVLRGNGITAKCARQIYCIHGHLLVNIPGKHNRYCPTCDSIRHKKRINGPNREYWLKKAREATYRFYHKNK